MPGRNRWLRAGLAVMFSLMALLALALSVNLALAQPPGPPATYYGPILSNANFTPLPGMTATAWITGTLCGQSQTFDNGGAIMYNVNVAADAPGGTADCGKSGRVIRFEVDGLPMVTTATWQNNALVSLPLEPVISLSGVTIAGPPAGLVNHSYRFTATISPPGATPPITYTWTPPPDSGQGTAIASYSWPTSGPQAITVTAQNRTGSAVDSHTINLTTADVGLSGVSIAGPSAGKTDISYIFQATISPITATPPVTYTWTPEPIGGQETTTAAYSWPTPGRKTIVLTVENVAGSAVGTHAITLTTPVTPLESVSIAGPVAGKTDISYIFQATIAPITATTPITYLWTPEPTGGQGTANVTYSWSTSGTRSITVSAQNIVNAVSDTQSIVITSVLPPRRRNPSSIYP